MLSDVKRLRVIVRLVLVLMVGLIGAHEACAQNGAITNPDLVPVVLVNPVVEPVVTTGAIGTPFIPPVIQPQFVITPSVKLNASATTDPLGNPYRNVVPDPLTIPTVRTPAVSPFSFPVIQNPS
jgi:hypothetical protein